MKKEIPRPSTGVETAGEIPTDAGVRSNNSAPAPRISGDSPRSAWLSQLAHATVDELRSGLERAVPSFDAISSAATALRPTQEGLVLVTARIGATGEPFAIGEATVTKCVLAVNGTIGMGFVMGRDVTRAELVALADALLQTEQHHARITDEVLAPVARRRADRDTERALLVEQTRVDFTTVVRGAA